MNTCPEPSRLRDLLDGNLPEGEQQELNLHLETCETCQGTLEGLVAGEESWSGAARQLNETQATPEPALEEAMAGLKGDRTETHFGDGAADGISLDFLTPTDQPNRLGMLDHYDIIEVVGKGGFGVVLKAFDPELHRHVAIKVLSPHLATSTAARKRFQREAKAAAAVSHEHVVAIHAVDVVKDLPYLVMQYVAGASLQERIDRDGPLQVQEILRIGMQAARGLAAAHAQGLVHRDIKPANILLENGVERVKISDFGLARAVDDASVTQSGVIAGTPQYMSPEQARGESVDHRTDLFSLGSVLYFMCTGRSPFRASTTMGVLKRVSDDTPRPVRDINPDIPDWLSAIIDKLHAKTPAERFQSAAEVAELLGQHLAHLQQPGVVPRPATVRPREVVAAPAAVPLPAPEAPTGVPRLVWFLVAIVIALNAAGPLLYALDALSFANALNVSVLLSVISVPLFLYVCVVMRKRAYARAGSLKSPLESPLLTASNKARAPRRWLAAAATLLGIILLVYWFAPGFLAWFAGKAVLQIETQPDALVNYQDDVKVSVFRRGKKVAEIAAGDWVSLEPDWYQLFPEGRFQHAHGENWVMELEPRELFVGPAGKQQVARIFVRPAREGDAVAVIRKPAAATSNQLADGLAWFPADMTFFGGRDMRVYPALADLQDLMATQLFEGINQPFRELVWKIKANLKFPEVDRITFAYVADSKNAGAQARVFVRVTGRLPRQRLLDLFKQHWPGVQFSEEKWFQAPMVTLISSSDTLLAPAVALVGETDMVLAGYVRPGTPHLDALKEVLEIRIGRRDNWSDARAAVLSELPHDTWAFLAGEPPAAMAAMMPFAKEEGRLPRRLVFHLAGWKNMSKNVHFHLRAWMDAPAEAEAFAGRQVALRGQAQELLKKPALLPLKPETATALAKTFENAEINARENMVEVNLRVPVEVMAALEAGLKDVPLAMIWQLGRTVWGNPPVKDEDVDELLALVGLQERALERVQAAYEAGRVTILELLAAQVDVIEAQVRLARTQKKPAELAARLRELVAKREEQLKYVNQVFEAGRVTQAAVDDAQKNLLEARIRLAQTDGKLTDHDRIQGVWRAVSGEHSGGQPFTPEMLRRFRVVFDGDRIRSEMPDGFIGIGTFALDTAREPKRLTVIADKVFFGMQGIYTWEGDPPGERLKVCISPTPEDPRPTEFVSKAGTKVAVVTLERDPSANAAEIMSFVPLFNGRDLTGWKTHPSQPGNWKVEEGVITCTGPRSHLFTERGDFENFHLRVEARINAKGDSGVFFRGPFDALHRSVMPMGYELHISPTYPEFKTGSLCVTEETGAPYLTRESRQLAPPDTWFTLDIIARGERLILKVNDTQVADIVNKRFAKGHIALQHWGPETVVQFRKIEIKELPPVAPAKPPSSDVKPGQDQPKTGTIQGTVTYNGPDVEMTVRTVKPTKDADKLPPELPAEGWYVKDKKTKGVQYAVVFLQTSKGAALPKPAADNEPRQPEGVMRLPRGRFEPRVLLLHPKQNLKLVNDSDPPIHLYVNLTNLRNAAAKVLRAAESQVFPITPFNKEPVRVSCAQHAGQMSGYVWKMDHPYVAVTDADGRFELKHVPIKENEKVVLWVWHEMLGSPGQMKETGAVAVKADEAVEVQVAIPE